MTSFSVVSLIAIVPDSEWRMPTLIVSSARAAKEDSANAPPTIAPAARNINLLVTDMADPILSFKRTSDARRVARIQRNEVARVVPRESAPTRRAAPKPCSVFASCDR